jgi:hypothetical protein
MNKDVCVKNRVHLKARNPTYNTHLVQEVEITPLNPKPGDQLKVTIKGGCNERTPVEIDHEQELRVVRNSFKVQINKIHVPWHKNTLLIEAKNVATMNVAAKFIIWITKKVNVTNGVAQYTLKDVPKGIYNIKLSGTAPQDVSKVIIKIKAISELQMDESGSCVYNFDPSCEFTGNFKVKCGQLEKSVEIKNTESTLVRD